MTLQVSIAPNAGVEVPDELGALFVDVIYTRVLGGQPGAALSDLPNSVQDTVRAQLDEKLAGSLELIDNAPGTAVIFDFIAANGAVSLHKTASAENRTSLALRLTRAEVTTIAAQLPQPPPAVIRLERRAHFVPVSDQRIPFESSKLQVAPVRLGNEGWSRLGLDRLFHADSAITSSMQWNGAPPSGLATILWTSVHVTIAGQFSFDFPKGSGDAWIWWLSGPLSAIGIVLDQLGAARATGIAIALPAFSFPRPGEEVPIQIPSDVTEEELVSNPNIYTEDPGEFCKPFKNPERVLGERSFSVLLRAEQPLISVEASIRKEPLPTITPRVIERGNISSAAAAPTPGGVTRPAPGSLIDEDANVDFVRHALPGSYLDVLRRMNRGRATLDGNNPIQWEGDVSRYQATTVARGHLLEFRMRWRSNGYSLGTVSKTLTLAPRQTKRIQKIEWRRSEISRRQETTRLLDQVSDELTREREYDDSVQANLSEWARGESESSTSAASGGFGFAAIGLVIGGGGGSSNASTTSSQEGGRRTSASEEQHLRDSIRRFGDSLRKLDSLVVNEVTQEETVTGTTEVVRNANYGHSLTVIYYQILRHLKIETGVAGVRECLFVPFAITPFTVARAYRWREFIRKGLRDPQSAGAVKYLHDVLTNFADSDVPPGRRSDQRVRYIFGSLFIKLAVERPKDKDDGSFDSAAWAVTMPYLGSPALSIFNLLKLLDESQRDAIFQKQHAPTIATNWVNTLEIDAGGPALPADFTLATRYQFNGVVRVDFSIPVAGNPVTRETLSTIHVKATKALPPGSIANLQSLTFTYETETFQHSVNVVQGLNDLITVETGTPDPGATLMTIPDAWERRNVRADITAAVNGLIEHLNEHVEYYHKLIWWNMDRDRLFMLIDGFYVPGTNQVSIASVVERDPIAIVGNSIVFRVSAGSFLGIGSITTPSELFNYYVSLESPSEPMLVSLPTDGLYAQTVMDECPALEEHFGSTDWVLNDPDPELGQIAPELLLSRRVEPQATQPTPFPQTLINLQNAPEAPPPSGLAGALAAVTTPNAFRDMAGLAGTQANAATALQTAAGLAANFGSQAAALKLADIAAKAQDADSADRKIATVQRAIEKGLTTPEEAQRHIDQILEGLHAPAAASRPHEDPALSEAIRAASGKPGSKIEAATPEGQVSVSLEEPKAGEPSESTEEQPPAEDGGEDETPLPAGLPWTEGLGRDVVGLDSFDVSRQTNPQTAFASAEHHDLGYTGLQPLIDSWALAGLVAGGAFIEDIDQNGQLLHINDWDISIPDMSKPLAPYGDLDVGSRAHWHWIIPNAYQDSDDKLWTPTTLHEALKEGRAATLSVGDIVMMSGDLVEKFDDFKRADSRTWRFLPANIMKGYERLEPFALTGLRLLQFPRGGWGKLDDLELLARNKNDYDALQEEIQHADPYWDRVKAVVEFLKLTRGPTGCSEILVLSRMLRHEDTSLDLLKKITPWVKNKDFQRLEDAIEAEELDSAPDPPIQKLKDLKINLDLAQLVISNGYYGQLALWNTPHFTPDNWNFFEDAHKQALALIDNVMLHPGVVTDFGPIPADAVARTAYAMHFLTDAFSSGHMRVPRTLLGVTKGLLAKIMHDIDGVVGLWCENGFSQQWRASGDGYLKRRSNVQKELLSQWGNTGKDTADDANYNKAIAAMSAAMKQLHYQAQKYFDDPSAQSYQDVLEKNRGDDQWLRWDEAAPDGTPGEPTAGRDTWIAMAISDRLAFLRKHQPKHLPSSAEWISNFSYNHPELIATDGSINTTDYEWDDHLTKLYNNRALYLLGIGYVLDITSFYQMAKNMPLSVADWYGPPEEGVPDLLRSLPERR